MQRIQNGNKMVEIKINHWLSLSLKIQCFLRFFFYCFADMMNLCTEEVRGGNVCFYRCTGCRHRKLESFGGNKEASESWKADEEAKKKKRRHNKWSGIATFCIFNSLSYLCNDHFLESTQTLLVIFDMKWSARISP